MTIKIRSLEELARLAATYKNLGNVIVTTNGCFDILHVGHLRALEESKDCGDYLIVGIDSDAAIKKRNKGSGRPIFDQDYRAEMVAALESVDYVTIYNFDNSGPFVAAIKPNIHANGPEYGKPETWVEYPEIIKCGAKTYVYTRHKDNKGEDYSTTNLIKRITGVKDV